MIRFLLVVFAAGLVTINFLLIVFVTEEVARDKFVLMQLAGVVVFTPLLIAALFCIPKSKRSFNRLLKGIIWVSLVLCVYNGFKAIQISHGGDQKIRGQFGKLEILVPSSWAISKKQTKGQAVYVENRIKPEGLWIAPIDSQGNSDAHLNTLSQRLSLIKGQAKIHGPYQCRSPFQKCQYYEMVLVMNKSKIKSQFGYFGGDKHHYFYWFGTSQNLYNESKKVAEKIIASIKVNK